MFPVKTTLSQTHYHASNSQSHSILNLSSNYSHFIPPVWWGYQNDSQFCSVPTTSACHLVFHLPSHKANCYFEGNHIIVKSKQYCEINPLTVFSKYLSSRDNLFPLSSPPWLMENGSVPTRNFFISRLHHYFNRDIAGQSMRAGGATSLAEHGVPPALIQLMGCWSSDAFFIYIRKSPVLIQALLYSNQQSSP